MRGGIVAGPSGALLEQIDEAPVFTLGTELRFANGDMFQYVSFSAAKAATKPHIVTSAFAATTEITTALAAAAPVELGVFLANTGTEGYGWIQRAGLFPAVELATSVNPDVELFTTTTAGRLSSAAGVGRVNALKNVGTATTGAGQVRPCFSASPLQIPTDAVVIN